MAKTVIVYALVHPETYEVRYIGKTMKSLRKRLAGHLCEKSNPHRVRWIAKLQREGLRPGIIALEVVPADGDWVEAECRWIKHYREQGANLLNKTDGGEGVPGRQVSDATRQKLREALQGRPMPAGALEASLAARTRPDVRAALSEAAKRRQPSPHDHMRQMSLRKREVGVSQETRAKQSKAMTGRSLSAAHREKLQRAQQSRPDSVLLTYDGRTQSLSDWAAEVGINRRTLDKRIRRGWSVERALTPARSTCA